MKCYLAAPASERAYQIFLSINQELPYCVEGLDFNTYLKITGCKKSARLFLMDRIMDGGIPTPDEGIINMFMSINGLDFKSIDRTINGNDSDPEYTSPETQTTKKDSSNTGDTIKKWSNDDNKNIASVIKPTINSGKVFKRNRKKKSCVWNFFIKIAKGGECKLCSKIISAPGCTTNLINHLKRSHNDTHQQFFFNESESKQPKTLSKIESNKVLNIQSNIIEPSKQPRIDVKLNRISSFKDGGTRSEKLTNALAYMIVKDDLPFCATEKTGLRRVINEACPHYVIPGRHKITALIEKKAEVLFLLTKKKFETLDDCSITADIWTETRTSRSFLGCTIHYRQGHQLRSVVLAMVELSERHTAKNISETFESILSKWNISKEKIVAVVTDNGPNMTKAVDDTFGKSKSLRCFAHSLNLVMKSIDELDTLNKIIEKVKKIVTVFKSPLAAVELKRIQDVGETLRLIQDIPTRWNSTFYMIERFLKILDPVVTALVKCDKSELLLSSTEILTLNEIIELLRPAEIVTRQVSGEKFVTSSEMLHHLFYLTEELDNIKITTESGKKMRATLLNNLKTRFRGLETHTLAATATLLDPRFKKIMFPAGTSYSVVRARVNNLLQQNQNIQPNEVLLLPSDEQVCDIWKYHRKLMIADQQSDKYSKITGGDIDLKKFLDLPIADTRTDPIEYWYRKKNDAPQLSILALKYLSVPATSAPSERLFSKAGHIVSAIRNRMNAEHLAQLLFLKSLDVTDWHLDD